MEYANYPNNYPDNENMDKFVEDYLDNYYGGYSNDNMEFPEDNELDNMYDNIHKEYMKKYGNYGQAYVSQGFNNFLWLALIAGLFRRFPHFRGRCRHDRRFCPRGFGGFSAGYGWPAGGWYGGYGGW